MTSAIIAKGRVGRRRHELACATVESWLFLPRGRRLAGDWTSSEPRRRRTQDMAPAAAAATARTKIPAGLCVGGDGGATGKGGEDGGLPLLDRTFAVIGGPEAASRITSTIFDPPASAPEVGSALQPTSGGSMRAIAAIAVTALVVVGCGTDDTAGETGAPEIASTMTETEASPAAESEQVQQATYSEECGSAMEEAASVGDMEDTVEDTDPAIVACATVDEFSAASADYPAALDGTVVTTWLTNRCQYAENPDVQSSEICAEISG